MFKKEELKTVTRYIGNENCFNREKNKVNSNLYYNSKSKREHEISVFDITKELENSENEKIFRLGDKRVCKTPPYTLARADLNVNEIKSIKIKNTDDFLQLKRTWGKHYIIFPFQSNAALLNSAQQLCAISRLVIRENNSEVI